MGCVVGRVSHNSCLHRRVWCINFHTNVYYSLYSARSGRGQSSRKKKSCAWHVDLGHMHRFAWRNHINSYTSLFNRISVTKQKKEGNPPFLSLRGKSNRFNLLKHIPFFDISQKCTNFMERFLHAICCCKAKVSNCC